MSHALRGCLGGAAIVELLKTSFEVLRRFLSEARLLCVVGSAGGTCWRVDAEVEGCEKTNFESALQVCLFIVVLISQREELRNFKNTPSHRV